MNKLYCVACGEVIDSPEYNSQLCWACAHKTQNTHPMHILSAPLRLCNLDALIAHDEHIACYNATVVVNDQEEMTAWFDNDKLLNIIFTEAQDD